jgi:methionyl aminopeptidase
MTFILSQEQKQAQIEGGQKLGSILAELLEKAQVGVSLLELEDLAQKRIEQAGGTPSFQTVEGYRWATCLCVDDVVVHGIPTDYVLNEGDVLTIDVGILYHGYHTDTAWTKIITSRAKSHQDKIKAKESDIERFLRIGEEALWKGISEAKQGNRIGHISRALQATIEGGGYSVVKSLVGHTVGRELHEAPQVPGFLKGKIEQTPLLTNGMTLAIEIIYAQGQGSIVYANDDGWTLATKDGSLASVFEHSIRIDGNDPQVLTRGSK